MDVIPRTIVLSSHLIDEIAKVVENIVIVEGGNVLLNDDADAIRSKSFMLKGSKEAMEKWTSEKRVIYREAYGNSILAAVFDSFDEEDRALAHDQGISIEGLPLQKFFAYLIDGGEHIE
ncbi:hypothetical protein [Cohnella soli]|uniref:ABC transporter ATP-binding protein n=1 Tax=Cohnella soli TaxID=425005 RepID=A0ABW0HYA8_9BACL